MSTQAVERTQQRPRSQPERQGAKASTKQMVRATVDGCKILFPTLGVAGYLVGMDDFHWKIADVTHDLPVDSYEVEIALVHKSAPLVRFSRRGALGKEPERVQSEVNEIGASFFAFCRKQLGQNTSD